MDNCFSKNYRSYGAQNLMISRLLQFKNIENKVIQKTSSLINEHNKNKFREGCRYLADYLIKNNNPPKYYEHFKVTWKGTLNYWLKGYYKNLIKYGGCPLILEEKDKQILELNYEEVDFCKMKNEYLEEIKRLSKKSKNSDSYSSKCNEYNEWIDKMKNYFEEKKILFGTCYQKTDQKKKKRRSEVICDLMDDQTFKKRTDCPPVNKLQPREGESVNEEIGSQTKDKEKRGESSVLHDSPEQAEQTKRTEGSATNQVNQDTKQNHHEEKNIQESESPPDVKTQAHFSSLETPSKEVEVNSENSLESQTLTLLSNSQPSPEVSGESVALASVPLDTKAQKPSESTLSSTISKSPPSSLASTIPSVTSGNLGNSSNKYISSILISFLIIIVFSLFIKYTLMGQLKKKKKIKRRQAKFLKILIPSHSDRKKEFLTHNHLEHPCYDDEEITKRIKILEHNMIKNLRESKQKKKRSKTIIEVHMEVLQEWKNEEWNYKKGEFLEICLDVLTKERYGTHSNLTNADLIMKNIKSYGHIEKQKILWNKWIERHKNISDKFKKVDWFNNLKNDWKKEKSYIKGMEELKNKSSNKYKNILFLEREKDVWRRWISEKGNILKQYIEQNWFNELSEVNQNILDEYINEEKSNDVSLINIEELEHRKNYEELYKYIKKKLLSKLCILVLMTILEECKKEEYIEDRELHLDSFINIRKTKKNSEKIPEISDKFIEKYSNVYENSKNSDIQNNIEENFFRKEMNDWIGEEVTYVNSTECVSNIDKYYNSTT
ncbi:STP1 protein [Plasmodium malariae]|uniref:STP1 protein n=1 Tax=Plasmodium malariae TaxID=5858 RepID=A0A1D3JID5_PLAMA|nr:STP1 protein [Plasmodium malariae]SBT86144.1 STP1 protein [Plasmodium malariae]